MSAIFLKAFISFHTQGGVRVLTVGTYAHLVPWGGWVIKPQTVSFRVLTVLGLVQIPIFYFVDFFFFVFFVSSYALSGLFSFSSHSLNLIIT